MDNNRTYRPPQLPSSQMQLSQAMMHISIQSKSGCASLRKASIRPLSNVGDSHAAAGTTRLSLSSQRSTSALFIASVAWKPHSRRDGRLGPHHCSSCPLISAQVLLLPSFPVMYLAELFSSKAGLSTWICKIKGV
jgi:hypothetical protein